MRRSIPVLAGNLCKGLQAQCRAAAVVGAGDCADGPSRRAAGEALISVDASSLPAHSATSPAVRTLVLYDTSGPWGHLGELYAIQVANLASHFGAWTAKPVAQYRRGDAGAHTAVIYVGSSYGEPMPSDFLDDVLAGETPVIWLDQNVWRLIERDPLFGEHYGWARGHLDHSAVRGVRYKGVELPRAAASQAQGLAGYLWLDRDRVSVLAEAICEDGTALPWAIRSRNLVYVGEIPFSYSTEGDRQLVLADLLFDLLAPATPERHRALVRLEDIGPATDPEALRAIGRFLTEQGVAFSFGVYPVHRAPPAEDVRLGDRPRVVAAIRDLIGAGGTMVLHGHTHQYGSEPNPYDGRSGSDFEFYRAELDADGGVRLTGPVPEDSTSWVLGRIEAAAREMRAAGLPVPSIFEFPHYAGSAIDYRAIAGRFAARHDRGLYFSGLLRRDAVDATKMVGQAFPYVVRDVYGSKVLPENLGHHVPQSSDQAPARPAGDIVAAARRHRVVRDGIAGFFHHPSLGLDPLPEIIAGIQAAGFQFVSARSLEDPGAP